MLGIIVDIISFIILLFLFYVLSMIWPPDSPWAPWWQTPQEVIDAMFRLVKLKKSDVVYDLGCGTGLAVITAAKDYGVKAVGVEIDPLRYYLAKWNIWRRKASDVEILKKNFFEVDLSPATVVVIYLIPNALIRLVPKFTKDLKKGTRIISYIYPLPLEMYKGKMKLLKEDKKNKIFIYRQS